MFPTGTKGPAPWRSLARPGGPLYYRLVFPSGTKGLPLVLGVKPGLKEGTFSSGLVLLVEKPGLKGFPNWEQKALLHQCGVSEPGVFVRLLGSGDEEVPQPKLYEAVV